MGLDARSSPSRADDLVRDLCKLAAGSGVLDWEAGGDCVTIRLIIKMDTGRITGEKGLSLSCFSVRILEPACG